MRNELSITMKMEEQFQQYLNETADCGPASGKVASIEMLPEDSPELDHYRSMATKQSALSLSVYDDVINKDLVNKNAYGKVLQVDFTPKQKPEADKLTPFEKAINKEVKRLAAIEFEKTADLPSASIPELTNRQVKEMQEYAAELHEKYPWMKPARIQRKVSEYFKIKLS